MKQKATISEAVIRKDRGLQNQQKTTGYELDKLRWEQCGDPRMDPRPTQQAYADAVGVNRSLISRSVNSWAAALEAQNPDKIGDPVTNPEEDTNGQRKQSDTVEAVSAAITEGKVLVDPTPDVHKKAASDVRHKGPMANVVTALSIAFNSTPEQVVKSKKPDWPHLRKEVAARATIYMADEGLSNEDACMKAARELKREDEISKELERNRKENEAARDSQGSPAMYVLNAVIIATKAFDRELKKIDGLDAVVWDSDTVSLLEDELGQLQGLIDRVRLLPHEQQITTAALDER